MIESLDESAALPRAKDERPRVNVRVSDKLYARIKVHCVERGIGMRHFAVTAFEQALKGPTK